jgi:uncharacterized protein (TIGR02757 family)
MAAADAIGAGEMERLYRVLNRREFVLEDPVSFLYRHADLRDREVVGLVASSLAYGRVKQIRASVSAALERLGPRPAEMLSAMSPRAISRSFDGFRHRFTTGAELAGLLLGVRALHAEHGTLGARFTELLEPDDETVVPALTLLVRELGAFMPSRESALLACPERGSACKRLHLLLRWMVRRDDVDPGGWDAVPRSKLVVPLDTHMHRISLAFGLTRRRQADLRTAIDVTRSLGRFDPRDPVKYDFAITRLGILKGSGLIPEGLSAALAAPSAGGGAPVRAA